MREDGEDLDAKWALSVHFSGLREPWKVVEQGCDLTRAELYRDHSGIVMEWRRAFLEVERQVGKLMQSST